MTTAAITAPVRVLTQRRYLALIPVWILAAVVVTLAAASLSLPSEKILLVALSLAGAATVAELFPVAITGAAAGRTSLATVPLCALAAIGGWQLACLAGAFAMGSVELARRRRAEALAYNVSLYALAGATAGAVSGVVTADGAHIGLLGASAFYLVNVLLLVAVVTLASDTPLLRVARTYFKETLLPFFVMATLTGALVVLYRAGPWYMPLLAPPLVAIAAYQTHLCAALERRQELDRLKDEFIAVVSHELRTPLASVLGAAQTLQSRSLPLHERARLLAMMGHQGRRLGSLIDEVLWAAKADRGTLLTAQPLSARELVDNAVSGPAAQSKPDNLTIVGDGDGVVLGDQAAIERVLTNLVENAIKYSPEGGVVTVNAFPLSGRIRFAVTDEGIGIPAGERDKVFSKFHRLDPGMLNGVGGTGLGLYISRRLLERMGGTIWIEPGEEKGTRVVFDLPQTTLAYERSVT